MSIIKATVGPTCKRRGCEFLVDISADVIESSVVYYVYVCLDI